MEKQNNQPYVSVIIPTYNRGYIIEKAIKSVLKQSYGNFEIIVVDDCSTDNTSEVMKKYESNEKVIYIALEKNQGGNYARNYGVKLAKYDYVAFQDSDDQWHENKLAVQVKYLLDNNYDFVGSKYYRITDSKKDLIPSYNIEKDYFATGEILVENILSTQTFLAKKNVFQIVEFDTTLSRLQDWDLVIRIIENFKVGFINTPLVDVYIQENSISNVNNFYRAGLVLLKKYKHLFNKYDKNEIYYYRVALYNFRLKEKYNYKIQYIKYKPVQSFFLYISQFII